MGVVPQPYADSFLCSANSFARNHYTFEETSPAALPTHTRIATRIPYTLAENLSVAFLILTLIPFSLPGRFRPLLFNPGARQLAPQVPGDGSSLSRPDRLRPLLHGEDGVGALPLQEALDLLTGNLEQFLEMMQTFRRQGHDGIVVDDVRKRRQC